MQTGVLVVDALFALGRGQRELIIGDRAIGKTTLAIDAIIAQKTSDIVSVYVAVGQKTSSVRRAIDAIQAHGDPSRCIFVVAEAASPPGLQWIAPFAGFTMAEYFRDRGRHALIVVDDLSKHAATHREIALLTRQSPGREAYPGDVFYLHARMLERAAKLSAARGGGSLTALPIAETDAGNLTAYIPTNLISIADGQIVLDARLFNEGQQAGGRRRPLSVSRVGGKTQAPALRAAAERLRLDYAQFLELEIFTRFGGMSDVRVRGQLTRGARIRAALDQPRHAPLRLADEAALMLAVQSGALDALPVEAVAKFRDALPAALDRARAADRPYDRDDRQAVARGRGEPARDPAGRSRRRWRGERRMSRPPRRRHRAHRGHRASSARSSTRCAASLRRVRKRRAARSSRSTATLRRSGPRSAGRSLTRRPRRPRRGGARRGWRWSCSSPSRASPAPSASGCSRRRGDLAKSLVFLVGARGAALAAERRS